MLQMKYSFLSLPCYPGFPFGSSPVMMGYGCGVLAEQGRFPVHYHPVANREGMFPYQSLMNTYGNKINIKEIPTLVKTYRSADLYILSTFLLFPFWVFCTRQ